MVRSTHHDTMWPEVPFVAWEDTRATLHMWMQVVGKICLALTPVINHYWNVTFRIAPRGLVTPLLTVGDRAFSFTFDFVEHRLAIEFSDGTTREIPLKPQTVAEFYRQVMEILAEERIEVHIRTLPTEVPDPIPFESDLTHRSYDKQYVEVFWRIMLTIEPVFTKFRAGFIGKCSPVHFFWGGFDLAVTRFSGRRAPERPEADAMTRESYSHEVISHGFWFGNDDLPQAAFYAYAAPEPDGFSKAAVRPSAAFYFPNYSQFALPYQAVRQSRTPVQDLEAFFASTYEGAAMLGGWNRAELER
ncbi:MAG TPA: DUF5996 family protein [Candidatus Eisenbacteria bacterium]|nr:DUF5996 family protein [Candidatus Eisenbacteria bacterium]